MAVTGSHGVPSAMGMMEDLQIGDGVVHTSKPLGVPLALQLTDQERQILELYDRLEELQLEISILKTDKSVTQSKGLLIISHYISRD
jgi:hypothetical protein